MTSPVRMTRWITRNGHAEPEVRTMWNFPLFPDQASTIARQVDALYFFELGIAGFFTVLICVLIVTFAVALSPRSRRWIARTHRRRARCSRSSGSACRCSWG